MSKLGLEKTEEPKIKLSTFVGSERKQVEFQKNNYLIDYAKAFDCMDHNKLENSSRDGNLTCLLRSLYAGQEATVRTGHGTMNWFKYWERSRSMVYIVTLLI